MRKGTFYAVSYGIALAIIFALQYALNSFGFSRYISVFAGSHLISSLVITPLVAAALAPFNRRLLLYRKARGRDIEVEERFETKGGMITLIEQPDNEKDHR